MKTTFKFFAAALAIVAAASCAKENAMVDNGRDEAPVEMVEVSFPATINSPADPTTKTTLSGLDVHWTEGDNILLYKASKEWGYSNSRSSLSASGVNGSIATFSGTAVSSDTYDAIYPLEAVSSGSYKSSATYNFLVGATLATQNVVANDFSKTSWGTSNIALASGVANGEQLKFNNILAHFKFQIASEGVSRIDITASAKDAENAPCNLGGQIVVRHSNHAIGVYSSEKIKVTNNGLDFEVGITYYVAIPPVTMTNLTFTFKDADGNVLHTLTKSASFTAESNTIYNLGSITIPEKEPIYKVVSSVVNASDLEEDGMYVISLKGDQSGYWANQDGILVFETGFSTTPTNNEFSKENVFIFDADPYKTPSVSSSYNHKTVGMWKSLSSEQYVSYNFATTDTAVSLNGTSSTGTIFSIANHWGSDTGNEVDMYKYESSKDSDQTIYYNNNQLFITFGTNATAEGYGGQPARKWYIYKVEEVE